MSKSGRGSNVLARQTLKHEIAHVGVVLKNQFFCHASLLLVGRVFSGALPKRRSALLLECFELDVFGFQFDFLRFVKV